MEETHRQLDVFKLIATDESGCGRGHFFGSWSSLGGASRPADPHLYCLISCRDMGLELVGWWGQGRQGGIFPLVLMLFSMNLEFITGEVSTFLRSNVSLITEKLSNLLGLGVLRNGSQLTSVDGLFHYDVAPGCSGIRSLVALIVLSLVIGKLSFSGWKRTMLLGLLALPFAFAGNVARIFGIVLVGRWFGQDAGVTFHDYSGFVVFVVVLGLAVLSSKLLQKFTPDTTAAPLENKAEDTTGGVSQNKPQLSTGSWAFLYVSLALSAGLSAWIIQLAPSPSAGIRLDAEGKPLKLPDYLVTLSGKDLYPSKDELEVLPKDTGFAYKQYVSLRDPRDILQVMLVLSGKDRSSIHKPEVCLPGQGWDVKSGETRSISIPQLEKESLPVTVLKISRTEQMPDGSKREVKALFSYWFVGAEDVVATHEQRQWLTATNRLFRFRFDRWAYVSVTAPINRPGDAGEEAAWQRIQDFAQRAVPKFQTAGVKK